MSFNSYSPVFIALMFILRISKVKMECLYDDTDYPLKQIFLDCSWFDVCHHITEVARLLKQEAI